MGKTPVPLTILCVGIWGKEFEQLQAQGHTVYSSEEFPASEGVRLQTYDLIVGPTCWRVLPEHMRYFNLALKEARAAKKAKKRPKEA